MVEASQSAEVKGKPWLAMGDLNQILSPSEHSRPASLNTTTSMRMLRDCLLQAELSDLVSKGNLFTWWNKSKERPIAKKLDRVLVNEQWSRRFPQAFANYGEPDFSDHASCSVTLRIPVHSVKRPFKFYNLLLQNTEFKTSLAIRWFSVSVVGSPMYRLAVKLKSLKPFIRDFSRAHYSGIEKRTAEAHQVLLQAQRNTLANPTPANATL